MRFSAEEHWVRSPTMVPKSSLSLMVPAVFLFMAALCVRRFPASAFVPVPSHFSAHQTAHDAQNAAIARPNAGDGYGLATSASTGLSTVSLLVAVASLGVAAARKGRTNSSIGRRASFDSASFATVVGAGLEPAQMPLAGVATVTAAMPSAGTPVESDQRIGMHLLMPKNIRWKKPHKPSIKPFRHSTKWKFRGYAIAGHKPHFGKYALQALEEAWITSKQIENVRRALIRTMERKGKMWIRVFPHQAVTQRVAESRMGAGKGSIEYWCAAVRPNFILFEMDGVSEDVARNAFRKAKYRLPCKVRMLVKDGASQFELGMAGTPGRGSRNRAKFEGASQ